MNLTGLVILNSREHACTFEYTLEPMRKANGGNGVGVILKAINLAGATEAKEKEEVQFRLVINGLTYSLKGIYCGNGRINLP